MENTATDIANKILAEVLNYRRVTKTTNPCDYLNCQMCSSPHLSKIISAVQHHQPVTFVLPAFPGKSPNPEKTLGHLPDLAERLSLMFLGNLCQRIKEYYAPGIKIILCSDGRVFSDVVGIRESNVSAYQTELNRLIKDMSLTDISTFNLDDFYEGLNFIQMRDELMNRFGRSLDFVKHKIRSGTDQSSSSEEQEANRMYRGITRFLFEDSTHSEQTRSRSSLQKESRFKAYEVIRRSHAWSDLIEEQFPEAVRLSIHPQSCGSKKLGIRLIANESWMTPWHGVAVEINNSFVLLKRAEAEASGAELIHSSDGRPSHYRLISATNLSIAEV